VNQYAETAGFHDEFIVSKWSRILLGHWDTQLQYTFQNFFHPLVGALLSQLNRRSLPGMLDATWQQSAERGFFTSSYHPTQNNLVQVRSFPEQFDLRENGPYANYNWELFFHMPLTVAVHLSKAQRFAEAQRWFHLIFDPTTDERGRHDLLTSAGALDGHNDLHVCVATPDGGIWHTIRHPDGSWEPLFGNVKATTSDPGRVVGVACAADASSDLHVCVATADGGIWHTIRHPDGSWQPFFGDVKGVTSDPGRVVGVACAADASSDLHVCVATADGGIWHTIRHPDLSWQPFQPGGELSAAWRVWKFLAFRGQRSPKQIDQLLALLSEQPATLSDEDRQLRADVLDGYAAILNKPFQPHAVARTRHLAYQYCVVMKYLDNLIAWGDQLFQQDTVEAINEATQRYVLATNLLGPRPQRIPPRGQVRPQTFAQLNARPHDALGNALVELEGQFPFNLDPGPSGGTSDTAGAAPLFGIGRTFYFCIPRNDKLLGYWDTVADRLFKIRHCMNIAGVVRPLALFDPPIDPGMLVKAAAAGLDVGSIVSGLNQPVGPVRCATMIQKALELCGEVRSLGAALLSAIEKGDAEHLALVRQRHETQLHELTRGVRYMQWRSAQEQTQSLLTSRGAALERFRYYRRLLGLAADPNVAETLVLDRRPLTEDNFDEAYAVLVGSYDKAIARQPFPVSTVSAATSPAAQAGAAGQGRLYLIGNEDADLNTHGPAAREARLASMSTDRITGILALIPDIGIDLHFWGLGGHANLFGGSLLAGAGRFISSLQSAQATDNEAQGAAAVKTAGFQRRADDWLLQHNLAANELMQNGRQILTALIAEQVAHHEYLNVQQQITNAKEIDQILHDKFSNEELYLWMQGEISRLYYEYYRFAFDTARKAERTMKQELMRPDLDNQTFVKFNYWDSGRKGLLSGEALHLDVKRMELAYLENNKRELELTRHVSLRQLEPVALLLLKSTGSCVINLPEWLYDRDCPGHYLRRIKSVALSIPSVVGPYTSLNCTLTLLCSSVRTSPVAGDDYARQGVEDVRFVDYAGTVQSIVTSGASNDAGLFETNLREDRFLPFEGMGAVSTWTLDLPKDFRAFDYATISDVILHVRYTARQGVDATRVKATLEELFQQAGVADQALFFSLRHDFPTEWAAFVNSPDGDFPATIRADYFPYFTHGKTITITGIDLYRPNGTDAPRHHLVGDQATWDAATASLGASDEFRLAVGEDPAGPSQILTRDSAADVSLVVRYTVGP
jgi:hypothetical protein